MGSRITDASGGFDPDRGGTETAKIGLGKLLVNGSTSRQCGLLSPIPTAKDVTISSGLKRIDAWHISPVEVGHAYTLPSPD